MWIRNTASLLLAAAALLAQSEVAQIQPIVRQRAVPAEVVNSRLQQYLLERGKALPRASSASAWNSEAARLRSTYLEKIIYRGWPKDWIQAPLKVEETGSIPSGAGYRMRKLRYEIVPGFWTTAILYLPDPLPAKTAAILNVNGHVGAPGKSVEYKQKRCITMARHGVISLNTEWIGCGELATRENEHWFGAHIDLAGATGAGVFYLAMRKGLDLLWDHPNVDRKRIGMTGLSGGGWQTINLSALDERVTVSVPVAGFSAFVSRVERPSDVGDLEQNPADSETILDYPHLAALRAPRPTLLVYNAEDDCCFRAPLVRRKIFDEVLPFFRLYGNEADLAWHQNADPGTHNYQLDNRQAAYRFFQRHLGLSTVPAEDAAIGAEVKSFDEMKAGLPDGNLTLLGIARKLSGTIRLPGGSREDLARTVRFQAPALRHPWALQNTTNKGVDARLYLFEFRDGLPAAGVRLQTIGTTPVLATVILNDRGKAETAADVSDRVNRGEDVLAADLLFTGDASPSDNGRMRMPQMLDAIGERALGIEAGQLIGLVEWMRATSGVKAVRLETTGMRSQLVGLVAAALKPGLFREVRQRQGIGSLRYLLDEPVPYLKAPDMFCHGLYQRFDLDTLASLAAPTRVDRIADGKP